MIRHRYYNRRCVDLDHLRIDWQRDNKHDDWAHWTFGMDGPGLPLTAKRECLRRNHSAAHPRHPAGHCPGHFDTRRRCRVSGERIKENWLGW